MLSRWVNALILKNSIIASTTLSTHSASFHSTSCSWKNKWSFDIRSGQQPSKSHIKYTTRLKRSDTKKALKDLLYNCGSSRDFQKLEGKCDWYADPGNHFESSRKKVSRQFGKSDKKRKCKIRRESFCQDEEDSPERIFQATFGNKWYTWTFQNSRASSFASSDSGFEWREQPKWTNIRTGRWDNDSDNESDYVGSPSDRNILGLPPTGPLMIEDVKKAFHSSALKWHPDKHQGPSQAMAEEKFKVCVNAYKSLCSALSTLSFGRLI